MKQELNEYARTQGYVPTPRSERPTVPARPAPVLDPARRREARDDTSRSAMDVEVPVVLEAVEELDASDNRAAA